jgi:hypothetical protein
MNRIVLWVILLFSSHADASTAFSSQFSHFSGGFFGAALVTYIIIRYIKKHQSRAIYWGIVWSTVYGFIDQLQQYIRHGGFWGQAYDFASHTLGTLLAAYLLTKIIKSKAEEGALDAAEQDADAKG